MGGKVDFDPALVEALRAHNWPGNVRELENTIARLLALAPDERITLALWRSLSDGASPSSTPMTAIGDPGPGHPLRGRVEAFERSLIAEAFEGAGPGNHRARPRAGSESRDPALIEKLHKYGLNIGRCEPARCRGGARSRPPRRPFCSRHAREGMQRLPPPKRLAASSPCRRPPRRRSSPWARANGSWVRSRFCDWPPEATKLPTVGGVIDADFEAIVQLAPRPGDRQAPGPRRRACPRKLRPRSGIATWFPDIDSLASIDAMIVGVGERTGRAALGREVAANIDAHTAAVEKSVAGEPVPRVLMVLDVDPVVATGPKDFVDELLRRAGAANVLAVGASWQTLDFRADRRAGSAGRHRSMRRP